VLKSRLVSGRLGVQIPSPAPIGPLTGSFGTSRSKFVHFRYFAVFAIKCRCSCGPAESRVWLLSRVSDGAVSSDVVQGLDQCCQPTLPVAGEVCALQAV
jgi:hypothetical protein